MDVSAKRELSEITAAGFFTGGIFFRSDDYHCESSETQSTYANQENHTLNPVLYFLNKRCCMFFCQLKLSMWKHWYCQIFLAIYVEKTWYCFHYCVILLPYPAWARDTPFPPLLLSCPFTSSSFALYYLFFSHPLYLFSSIVHPIPFYQNSPTPFPGVRS